MLTPELVPALVPAPVLGVSSSLSLSSSPASAAASAASSCPRKNLSAATRILGEACLVASATRFTVRASFQTLRRYSSVSTASAFFAAATFSSMSADRKKFCTDRFSVSSRFVLLARRTAATTCANTKARSGLSSHRNILKKSGSKSPSAHAPRLCSRINALVRLRRKLGSSSA